jgi:hypothetical protein
MAKLIVAALAVYLVLVSAQAGIEPVKPALSGASDVSGCLLLGQPLEG